MSVTYEISGQNDEPAFSITYEAVPDQDTLISMTHHSYYNLNGEGSGDILNHKVTLAADFYTPTDAASVPTGEITSVTGTVMDFRDGRYLGTDIEASTLQTARGYDHNWVIGTGYGVPHKVLTATGDQSGISHGLIDRLSRNPALHCQLSGACCRKARACIRGKRCCVLRATIFSRCYSSSEFSKLRGKSR